MQNIYNNILSDAEFEEIQNFDDCIFCLPPSKKIFIETQNFYVTYDASALMEGHLLIHTKEHVGCSGEIRQELMEEFINLKNTVYKIIKDIYGQVSFYEHGRAGHCGIIKDGIMCHHFHMHALPLSQDISERISIDYPVLKFQNEQEILDLYQKYDQYLFFEDINANKFFYPINKEIPSHYIRTVIAEAIGYPERADWENCFNKENINNFISKQKNNANGIL